MSELAPFLRHALPGWQVARRYAVPPAMVERATARRLAGDWRGACAAARFDVLVDPADIRDRYGADLADRVEDDLRHLVPDLVRWHLPREHTGGLGRVVPNLPVTLARYDDGPALWVRTPVHLERPLRPQLRFGVLDPARPAVGAERWDGARYLWDVRATDGLRHRLGHEAAGRIAFHHRDGRPRTADELPAAAPGPDDPVALLEWVLLLLDAGRIEDAWAAAGVPGDIVDRDTGRWLRRLHLVQQNAMVPALAAAVRHLLATDPPAAWTDTGRASFVLQPPATWYTTLAVTARAGNSTGSVPELDATLVTREHADAATVLPRVTWQRFPDLELLRTGQLSRDGLHPLVHSALFPDDADPAPFATGPTTTAPATVAVRCRGGWHRVGWRDGHVDPHDHTPEEARREQTMRSLGGVVPKCFTVTETWRLPSPTRLPRRLRELRRDGLAMITNGDVDGFLALLDAGVDPAGIRDRRRRAPLHLAAHLDGPGVEALVGRLIAAGLDVNGGDSIGRTPLGTVLFDGGSAALVRALLDAGADPRHTDDMGSTTLHLLRSLDAATILPWLLDAGLDLEETDEYGRTPLMAQAIAMAPPEAMRAMVNAGADPGATDEYSEMSIEEQLDANGYDDLDFLRVTAGGQR